MVANVALKTPGWDAVTLFICVERLQTVYGFRFAMLFVSLCVHVIPLDTAVLSGRAFFEQDIDIDVHLSGQASVCAFLFVRAVVTNFISKQLI